MEIPIKKKRKRRIDKRTIAYLIIFLIGVATMLYPTISNAWNNFAFKRLVSTYDEDIEKAGREQLEKELRLADEYNINLLPKKVPDAFSIRDGIKDEEYESLLNISNNGMMGYIIIPAIDVEIPIYHYTNESALKKGAGHLPGSSLPVGGKGTHAVLSAHRGLPSAKLFSDLNLLENGDSFYIKVLTREMKYEVDQVLIVQPDQTESLALSQDNDYVTLVTCTPYGVNTHRLLVRGHRVPNDKAFGDESKKRDIKRLILTLLSIISGALMAYIVMQITGRKRKKHGTKNNNEKEQGNSDTSYISFVDDEI